MKKFLLILMCFLYAEQLYCQLADLARLEYTYVPGSKSDFSLNRQRALFNYPIKIKDGAFLLVGLDYSHIDITFEEEVTEFDKEETKDFNLLDLNIAYTFPINEDWRFGARISTGFSSNLSTRDVLAEDFVLSSDVVFIKDKKDSPDVKVPYRLIVGISYSGNRGIPFPLPFISYYRKFHKKWSYNVGVPVSNLQYHWSDRFRVKLFAQLDGFNSNLQRRLLVNNQDIAENFRLSLILGGLRYEYKIAKHVESFLNTTYIFNNVIQLRANQESIFELDSTNEFHFRVGIRLKI